MVFYKKYMLWFLLIGMISTPAEQVQTKMFYDEHGNFTMQAYTFGGAAAVGAAAACYAGYRYLYPKTSDQTNQKTIKPRNKTDFNLLLCTTLCLQVMAIVAVNEKLEQSIYRPRRLQKIAWLDDSAVLAWKAKKNIYGNTILNEEDAIELLTLKLKQIKVADSLSIPFLARMTAKFSYDALIKFINQAGLLAIEQEYGTLDIDHIEAIYFDTFLGQKSSLYRTSAEYFKTSIHEAGHAVIGAQFISSKLIMHKITIIPHRKEIEPVSSDYHSLNRVRRFLNFAGATKAFMTSKNDALKHWSEDDLKQYMKLVLAGGIAEQVCDLPYSLPARDKEKGSLSDFLSRPGVMSDLQQARKIISLLAQKQRSKTQEFWNYKDLEQVEKEILQESYDQTWQDVQANKKHILNVAAQLRKNKNSWWGPKDLSGKELYKIIGKPQPLYDFEQKDGAAKP